jgi:hypothetical protein
MELEVQLHQLFKVPTTIDPVPPQPTASCDWVTRVLGTLKLQTKRREVWGKRESVPRSAEVVGPTEWAPTWPTSSEQQFPIAPLARSWTGGGWGITALGKEERGGGGSTAITRRMGVGERHSPYLERREGSVSFFSFPIMCLTKGNGEDLMSCRRFCGRIQR